MKSTTTEKFEDRFESNIDNTKTTQNSFNYEDNEYDELIKMYTDHEEGS